MIFKYGTDLCVRTGGDGCLVAGIDCENIQPLRVIRLLKGMKILGIVKEEVLCYLEAGSQF